MDQSELRRQVNAISNVKNSLTRVASPTPMLSRASPIPLLATSEIGAVILPTSSLLASSSSNPSFAASGSVFLYFPNFSYYMIFLNIHYYK